MRTEFQLCDQIDHDRPDFGSFEHVNAASRLAFVAGVGLVGLLSSVPIIGATKTQHHGRRLRVEASPFMLYGPCSMLPRLSQLALCWEEIDNLRGAAVIE